MKKIVYLLATILPLIGKAQLNLPNLNLSNSAFGYYDPNYINLNTSNSLGIGNSNYLLQAGNYIHIPASTHVSLNNASVSGYFNAKVANQQLDATFQAPVDITAVPKFSKLEMGVSIPSVAVQISTFLNDPSGQYKPGTTPANPANGSDYVTAFNNGTIINPYDPAHVTVDMVLFRPSSPNSNPVIRHGFYYVPVTKLKADWSINTTSSAYPWRIRFAPDEMGTWTGYVCVYIGGKLIQANKSFSFNVVSSSNPGFIQKGPNPSYLQYSGSGLTYIPIGNNYTWPETSTNEWDRKCYTQNCNLGVAPNSSGTITPNNDDLRITPNSVTEMSNFVSLLTSTNSANTTRLLMSHQGFQIEVEKLGNYDSRQIEMSVLDDYIGQLEQNNVKLILGQLAQDLSYYSTGYYFPTKCSPNFDCNPYNGANINQPTWPGSNFRGIAGINSVSDLLNPTNPSYQTALQLYKNRWRYIEARWGYSTAISTYELLTEVDQITDAGNNGCNNIYWGPNGGLEHNMALWLTSIAQYLKVDLGTKHLTTVSYAGNSDVFRLGTNANPSPQLSQIFTSPYIDIVSGHAYGERESLARKNFSTTVQGKATFPTKPVYLNECDALYFDVIALCTDLPVHNLVWSSIFSGSMGPGLAWSQMRNAIQWFSAASGKPYSPAQTYPNYGLPNTYAGEYEKNYPAFVAFTNQIDFKNTTYNSYYSPLVNGPAQSHEVFYMVDISKLNAYGWAHNRSYTVTNNTQCFNNVGNYSNLGQFRDNPKFGDVGYDPLPGSVGNNPALLVDFKKQAPQTPSGYFYNEDHYVDIFGAQYDPKGVVGETIQVGNLLANYPYTINWYWTWGSKGGQSEPSYKVSGFTDASGNLTLTVPPTGTLNGTLFPGDWAFKVSVGAGRLNTGTVEKHTPKLTVSPNPSSNVFYISGVEESVHEKAHIELFDISGKLLMSETIADADHFPLDLRDKTSGVYILKITINEQQSVFKLMKTE